MDTKLIRNEPGLGLPWVTYGGSVSSLLRFFIEPLLVWQQRASERRHLASQEPRLLADMGLDREQVAREIAKPFWLA